METSPILAGLRHSIPVPPLAMSNDLTDRSTDAAAGDILESLLESLLRDFEYWFTRGYDLIEQSSDEILTLDERQDLSGRLEEGLQAVKAARALTRAAGQPVAVSMKAMAPWHGLVTEVWGLSARLGRSQA